MYPEYLPDALTPPAAPTNLDRLMLDQRVAPLQAKAAQLVYHPADTHWSAPGVVIQEVVEPLLKWDLVPADLPTIVSLAAQAG